MASVIVATTEPDLAKRAAGRITTLIEEAVHARGSAILSLTGGTTPRRLYSLLADGAQPWRTRIPWPRVHLFWGDERHVPPDHPDSNYGMAAQALIEHVPLPAEQVHRMRGELADAGDAAREYARELRTGFTAAGRHDRTFDVMLLGLGEDAHIASIFPGSELLQSRSGKDRHVEAPVGDDERVAAVWAQHLRARRITLTPDTILDARAIVLLVAGAQKAHAVHVAIEAPLNVARWPAQILREADGRVEWIIDRAAAAQLHNR